jgi:hypothetical protein
MSCGRHRTSMQQQVGHTVSSCLHGQQTQHAHQRVAHVKACARMRCLATPMHTGPSPVMSESTSSVACKSWSTCGQHGTRASLAHTLPCNLPPSACPAQHVHCWPSSAAQHDTATHSTAQALSVRPKSSSSTPGHQASSKSATRVCDILSEPPCKHRLMTVA